MFQIRTLRKGLFQEKKYGLDIITMTNQKFFLNSKLIVLKGSLKDQKKISLKDFNNFCIKGKHDPSYGVCLQNYM